MTAPSPVTDARLAGLLRRVDFDLDDERGNNSFHGLSHNEMRSLTTELTTLRRQLREAGEDAAALVKRIRHEAQFYDPQTREVLDHAAAFVERIRALASKGKGV